MKENKEENLHAGHRNKVRERFKKAGLDAFCDHEVLELILFYSIPRMDVNETAHRLIKRFGSLKGTLDASITDLEGVEGIGKSSAVLIKTYSAVAKRYFNAALPERDGLLPYRDFGRKLILEFSGSQKEKVFALFLDNSLKVCGEGIMHEGDMNSVGFSMRNLAAKALDCGASFIVLAHNHPGGMPIASSDDLHTTGVLKTFIAHMGITLIDHFIVADDKFSSIDRQSYESYRRIFEDMSMKCAGNPDEK